MRKPLSTVSARFVNNFLEESRVDRNARARLVRQAGIVPALLEEPGTRVTEEQFALLYRLLVAQLDDELPGMFSRPLRTGATRFLCLSLLDAPTLQAALHRYIRFHRIVLDDFAFALERGPEAAGLVVVPDPRHSVPSVMAQQLLLKFVHSLLSWLLAVPIPVLRLQFGFAPPPDADEHAFLYPGPVAFAQPQTALCFPAGFLDAPLARRSQEDVRRFLARAPQGWIFTATAATVSQRVREHLESRSAVASDIESVAAALHYSVRTLCRRLESEGTSFRLIKDELRRDLAVNRLTQTSRSIAAIAFELGFEDATAFYRAFKHWTGSTPGAYRRDSRGNMIRVATSAFGERAAETTAGTTV